MPVWIRKHQRLAEVRRRLAGQGLGDALDANRQIAAALGFFGRRVAQLRYERKREIGLHRRVGFAGERFWDIVPDDHSEASRLERIAEASGDAEAFGRRP